MELLPKNAESDIMKLQSDEGDDDEDDSGDDAVESDGEDDGRVGGCGGNGAEDQRGEQVIDKVGAKRKKGGGEGKVTPSKKTKE